MLKLYCRKAYMLFSLNEWGPLNGSSSCNTYNFRIKVGNVQGSFVVKSDLLFCEQGTISTVWKSCLISLIIFLM